MKKSKVAKKEYSKEFKAEAVKLVLAEGRKQAEVARSLGISSGAISKWCLKEQASKQGVGVEESRKIRELESEIRQLKLEREIFKKAAAYFAKNQ